MQLTYALYRSARLAFKRLQVACDRHNASDGTEIPVNLSNQRHPRSMRYLQAGYFLDHTTTDDSDLTDSRGFVPSIASSKRNSSHSQINTATFAPSSPHRGWKFRILVVMLRIGRVLMLRPTLVCYGAYVSLGGRPLEE